jgi:hypothetical protein
VSGHDAETRDARPDRRETRPHRILSPDSPRFGRFELRGELGRGGMGVVYRAWDPGAEREVALKTIHAGAGSSYVDRLRREAELVARLRHPGILTVHEAGEVDGSIYLVSELVDGAQTLGEVIQDLPWRRRVELVQEAAVALGHAHAAGMVHRDVKAENILVDGQGHARVIDFGLALADDQERLTQTGGWVGTPSSLPPERLNGDRLTPEPTDDVWGLGVVLYEALTGRPPFDARSLPELLGQIRRATPPPPRELEGSIPAAVERVCLQALRRDPRDRPADGAVLAQALDDALHAEEPASRRAWWVGGALVTLAGGGGIALALTADVAPVAAPAPSASTSSRLDPALGRDAARALQLESSGEPEAALRLLGRVAAARPWTAAEVEAADRARLSLGWLEPQRNEPGPARSLLQGATPDESDLGPLADRVGRRLERAVVAWKESEDPGEVLAWVGVAVALPGEVRALEDVLAEVELAPKRDGALSVALAVGEARLDDADWQLRVARQSQELLRPSPLVEPYVRQLRRAEGVAEPEVRRALERMEVGLLVRGERFGEAVRRAESLLAGAPVLHTLELDAARAEALLGLGRFEAAAAAAERCRATVATVDALPMGRAVALRVASRRILALATIRAGASDLRPAWRYLDARRGTDTQSPELPEVVAHLWDHAREDARLLQAVQDLLVRDPERVGWWVRLALLRQDAGAGAAHVAEALAGAESELAEAPELTSIVRQARQDLPGAVAALEALRKGTTGP